MDTTNLPSIDRRLSLMTACIVALALALAAGTASSSQISANLIIPVLVFGCLLLIAEHLELMIRSGVDQSGGVMIVIASIVVFRHYQEPLGPMLVGTFILGFLPLLKERAWLKLAFNTATSVLGTAAASVALWVVPHGDEAPMYLLVIGTAVAAWAYLVVNAFLVSLPVSISCREPYRKVLGELAHFFGPGSYAFALVGLGLGWVYLEFGAFVVPLLVVPILIARGTFKGYLELQAAQDQTIETLIRALEAKDRYTAGHAQRVATFAAYVGEELNFGPKRMERLRYAALMHDIGKLVVPNQLLNKPGRLTEAEFARVRRHEEVSVALLGGIDFLAPVAPNTTSEAASRSVEEVAGPVEPGIIMVADAFDAMTSTRSYRKALTQEVAFEELRKNAGKQFRADCVEALIAGIERRGERYGDGFEVSDEHWEVAPPVAGVGSAGLGDLLPEERATR